MNKKTTLCVALGCATAFAATNYDLLGRSGSKMNSPMVYKDANYHKVKKNGQEEVASQQEKKALMKLPSGVVNVAAIEGAFNTRGFEFENGYPLCYYFSTHTSSGITNYGNYKTLNGNDGGSYLYASNPFFIPINVVQNYTPSGLHTDGNASNVYGWDLTEQYTNPSNAVHFSNVESNAKRWGISWFDASGYSQCQECGDVGIYMDVDAFPVRMDPTKTVKYYVYDANDHIFPNHGTEVLSSKAYSILQATTKNASIYITNTLPANPASRTPQVYVGLHNRKNSANVDHNAAEFYGAEARDLDNYIYNNRTVEVVAAGDYWIRNNNGQLNAQAHAANAITVGAIDATNGTIASYTSNKSKYCMAGLGNCANGYNVATASDKPEIFNYSHFYMGNDRKRTYTNWFTQEQVPYERTYEGTETAAAYTANMVADLLRANPFYRWHPEVVKAMMIASGDVNINQPYPSHLSPVTTKIPTYKSVVFNRFSYQANPYDQFFHESHYWVGKVSKLSTHRINKRYELRFSVQRPTNKSNFSAAIAWLSSGNDIANLGKIPQDFDLYVYENTSADVDAINVDAPVARSTTGYRAFEKVSFTSSAPYLTFRIVLFGDDDRSENNGQMVLGFDLAAAN
ncbi:MAG: hypothetical protein IK012_09555 [Fibrobacter sp.]|uniref:S8 family serine peptidase n=1 Tax=Fibrobacter sp. TaxID=35828 RepID=UPI0025BAA83D|nr:S8 family serine peptidase [Fibrobacter sp.]MBR4785479.1 hypothetical protein [Fibrobacter sp.]